jgi:hypothetical protein
VVLKMPSLRSLLKVAAAPKLQLLALNKPSNTVQTVIPQILKSLGKPVSFVPELNESEINEMSLLKHIGTFFEKVLQIGSVIAVAAKPIVAVFAPQLSGLFSSTVDMVIKAEGVAASTGGTGEQKAAAVVAAITPDFNAWATANHIVVTPDQIKRWNDGVVALLNIFSAPTVPVAGN